MASSSSSFERTLAEQLRNVGNGLLDAPSSVDELLALLDDAEDLLANMEQGPSDPLQDSLLPVMKALIADSLLKHSVEGVRVSVAYCHTEVLRISAPQEPFNDDQMKVIFELIVEAFSKLSQASTQYREKALSILETVARAKACLLMLDLKCDALVVQMFQNFWAIIRSNPADEVAWAVEQIMTDILSESEDISLGLLSPLLASVLKENKNVAPLCWKLGERVIARCAAKLGPVLHGAVQSNGTTVDDYSPVVASICENEPTNMENNHANGSSQPVNNVERAEAASRFPEVEVSQFGNQNDSRDESSDGESNEDNVYEIRFRSKDVAPSCWKLGERVITRCAPKLGPVLHGAVQSNGTTVDDYSPVVASICENEPTTMENNHANNSSQPVDLVERAEAPSRFPEVEVSQSGNQNGGRDESSDDESTEDNLYEIRFRSKDNQLEFPSSSTSDDSTPEASPPKYIRAKSKDVQQQSTSDDSTPEASPPRPWGQLRSRFQRH